MSLADGMVREKSEELVLDEVESSGDSHLSFITLMGPGLQKLLAGLQLETLILPIGTLWCRLLCCLSLRTDRLRAFLMGSLNFRLLTIFYSYDSSGFLFTVEWKFALGVTTPDGVKWNSILPSSYLESEDWRTGFRRYATMGDSTV